MRNPHTHTRRTGRRKVAPTLLLSVGLLSLSLTVLWLNSLSESARQWGADSSELLSVWLLIGLSAGAVSAKFGLKGFNVRQCLTITSTSVISAAILIATFQTLTLFGILTSFIVVATFQTLSISLLMFASMTISKILSGSAPELVAPALTGAAVAAIGFSLPGQVVSPNLVPFLVVFLLLVAHSPLKHRHRFPAIKTLSLTVIGGAALIAILQVTISRHEHHRLAELVSATDSNTNLPLRISQFPGFREIELRAPQSFSRAGRWDPSCDLIAPEFIIANSASGVYEFPVQQSHDNSSTVEIYNNDLRFIAGQISENPTVCALSADGATVLAARSFGASNITAVWEEGGASALFRTLYPSNESRVFSVHDRPRAFLERSPRPYDLIFLPAPQNAHPVSTMGSEHTVEGYEALLGHLSDRGMISYSMQVDGTSWPTLIRALQSAVTALDERGERNPANHVSIIAGVTQLGSSDSPGSLTVIISAQPLGSANRERLIDLCATDRFKSLVIAGDVYYSALQDILRPGYGPTLTAFHNQPLGPLRDSRPYPAKPIRMALGPVGTAIAANAVSGEFSLRAASARAKLFGDKPQPNPLAASGAPGYLLPALLAIGAFLTVVPLRPRTRGSFMNNRNVILLSTCALSASIAIISAVTPLLHPGSSFALNYPLWGALPAATVGAALATRERHIRSRAAGLAILSAALLFALTTQLPDSELFSHARLNAFLLLSSLLTTFALAGFGVTATVRKALGRITLSELIIAASAGAIIGLSGARYLCVFMDLRTLTGLSLAPVILASLAIALPLLRAKKSSRRYRLM